MTPEKSLWLKVRKGLQPHFRMQRIEDRYSKGVPDLIYAGPKYPMSCLTSQRIIRSAPHTFGLIELKVRREWPKRATTPVKLKEWKPEQKAWFKLFGPLGKHLFLLLQIENDYMLYDWRRAVDLGDLNKEATIRAASHWWHKKMNFEELANALTDPLS